MLSARQSDAGIAFQLLKPDDVLTIDGTIQLEQDAPEFVVELAADREMREPLRFPAAVRHAVRSVSDHARQRGHQLSGR